MKFVLASLLLLLCVSAYGGDTICKDEDGDHYICNEFLRCTYGLTTDIEGSWTCNSPMVFYRGSWVYIEYASVEHGVCKGFGLGSRLLDSESDIAASEHCDDDIGTCWPNDHQWEYVQFKSNGDFKKVETKPAVSTRYLKTMICK